MALIELKDVTKKYDKSTTALRHIDLSVNSGEFVYLVGPSGAGKSSLIRLFYQEEKLTSGSMKVGEFDLTRLHTSMWFIFRWWKSKSCGRSGAKMKPSVEL